MSKAESRRASETGCIFLDPRRGNLCTRHMLYCVRSQFCGYRPKPDTNQVVLLDGVSLGIDKRRGLSPDFFERLGHVR